MTQPEEWMLLKDGAAKVAAQRLSDTHQYVTTAIAQFHDDAVTAIEGVEGESDEGLGLEIFKALTDVLVVVFPEELIVEKVAGEAFKGFRDVLIAGISAQQKETAATTLAHAKDQLRHVLDDLVASARSSSEQGWAAGHHKIDESLSAYFNAHPEYKNAHYGDDANVYEQGICDQIGIRDAALMNPSAQIIEALWHQFNHELARTAWKLQEQHVSRLDRTSLEFAQWAELTPHERAEHLAAMPEPDRESLLDGGALHMLPDAKARWLHIAALWHDPTTHATAEMELIALTAVG